MTDPKQMTTPELFAILWRYKFVDYRKKAQREQWKAALIELAGRQRVSRAPADKDFHDEALFNLACEEAARGK